MYSHDPRRPQRDPVPYQRKNGYWSIIFRQKGKHPTKKWMSTGIQSRYFDNWKAHVPHDIQRLLIE